MIKPELNKALILFKRSGTCSLNEEGGKAFGIFVAHKDLRTLRRRFTRRVAYHLSKDFLNMLGRTLLEKVYVSMVHGGVFISNSDHPNSKHVSLGEVKTVLHLRNIAQRLKL